MLSYNEMKNFGKKAEKKKQSDRDRLLHGADPAKEAMYKKWQETKVAGGTVNPIISTNPNVTGNQNLTEKSTYEQSKARDRERAKKYSAAVPASAKAAENIKELIFGAAKHGGTVNPTISAADFSTRFDKMTARENAVYTHYKKAGKHKEAAEYLKSIEKDINKRAAAQRTADAKKLAEDSTLGGLYARYMGALTTPLATAYSLVQDARGEAIDLNSPLFVGEQIRQGQTEGFLGESKGPKKWMKEAALGAFDWGTQVATLGAMGLSGAGLGAASSGLYGASAFGGNVKDATERGASTDEAITYGTIGAAAEIITERLGFERLFNLGKFAKAAGGKGRLAMEILKNMGSEGLEEGTSEAANQIADVLIMGDRSQMAETYRMARGAGQTEGQATATALRGAAAQIGYSAGIGALSGGMIAGGIAGGSRLAGWNVLGEETQRNPMEQERAMEQEKPVAEQNMSSAEQTAPITEQTAPVVEQEKPVTEREMPMAEVQKAEQQTAEVREMGQDTAISEDLKEYSGKYYGEKGQEVYLRRAEETGSLDHTAAFNTYYRAGIAGIREDEIRQTAYTAVADKLLKNEAYMAGAEDRKAEIANAICGTSKLTGKRGLIVGEDVKATKEQLALASLYADVGGARIRLVDEISFEQGGKKHTANGYYEDGVITLALKTDSFMGTVNHEMIHYIRKANPAGYDAMRELVFKMANKDGTDIEKHWAKYEELCRDIYGEDVAAADVMEEMVADGFQKILNNTADMKEFLTELYRKDKTLFDRIKEFLVKVGKTIKALLEDNTYTEFAEDLSRDLENIRKLRKKFAEVLADTGRMEEGEGAAEQSGEGNRKHVTKETEAKFSLMGKTKDGIEVYETSEEIKKLPYAERMEMFVSIMENEYHRRTAKFRKNGNVYYARFAGEDVKKNIWGDKQSDKEGWKAKINVGAEGNIFELVENATYTGSKEEVGKRAKAHAGVLKWDYYVKRVQINGRVYDLLANVREKQDGEYIYNIGLKLNKKIAPAPPLAPAYNRDNGMATLQGGVTADTINQSVAQKAAENNNRNVTKFSLRDSDGNKLSEEQKEYFKDSKAVDENGNLLVMYHGTKKGGFTTFRDWSYLTTEKKYAERYTDHNTKETVYKVYANMENPFDTRLPECREIFENEFFGSYSRTPLQETGLPDWTDGYDLAEFIEENEYDFDGILLDEGADADESGEIIERGISYVIRSSEQIKNVDNTEPTKDRDIRFSIRKKDVDTKTAENENWKAAYEGLLREFEITKEPLRDREAAQKVVRKFLKEIKSGYDEEQFLDRFVSLCNYGADLKSDSDYKDLVTACAMLAEDALRESTEMDMELYNEYADLRKELRTSTLRVGRETVNDLLAQDIRYNELRQANFGRVKLSQKDGESIDTKYAEWAERFPELFKADQNTSQSELLMDIIAVRQSLDPVVKNPYFDIIEEHAAACAYQLLGMMNDVALEKQTFADKYEEKLRKLRQENKEALRRAKEQAKNEKQLLREKYATNAEARIAAVKEKYEKRMDRSEYWRLRRLAVKDAKALAEWMKSPTDSKHIPKKFKETVSVILGLIETEKPDLKIPLQSFVTMKGALQELYGDTNGMYLYVEQDDQVINILDRFIQKYPEGANLDTMSGADMKYFRNLIASVKKACTDANKLHTSRREESVVDLANGYMQESMWKKDARETGIVRRMQDFLGLEMLDANSFFKRIGGGVYSELWKGLRKGLDKKINHWREAMDFINGLVDPKTVRKWTDEAPKEFEIEGKKVRLTVPQMMSLYCLMKRDQGRQHIIGARIPTENGILEIKGGGFKAEPAGKTKKGKKEKIERAKVVNPTAMDMQKILDCLTEEQKKAAAAIQSYLSTDVAEWGNETTMLLYGYEKFTTKNYFPIVSDKNFVNQLVTKTEDIAPSLKSLGMTKNINRFASNPIIIQDIFKVFANHVDQMSNYNAFAASESDFNKFMNYKVKAKDGTGKVYSVKNEMDRTMGQGGAKYIRTLMNRLVTASGLSDDSDFAKMLVRNMKVASVGANLRVIVQQPTAYLRAGNSLSMKYLLNPAVFKKTEKETIYKYAPIALWKSWGNYEMDTGKTMYEQMIAPTKFNKTKELMMAGAGWADEVTWSRLWNACVLEAKDKHKGATQEELYRRAGERFSDIIDESQVVDSVLHRSQIMRKKGLYTQMTTSFMSEPTKTFNMASNALVELVRNNTPENRRKFIRCYMTIIASSVATGCAAALVDAMRNDDDDDTYLEKWRKAVLGDYSEAETPKDYVMAVMSNNIADNLNPMSMIPYLRDGWSLLQGYDVNRTDFDWLNDIMKNMKRWEKYAAGESEYTLASLLLNSTGALSKITGVPVGSLERDMKALTNWVILHVIGDDEMKYNYRKLSRDIGAEKNTAYYAEKMLQAKFSGNNDLATRIYNEMIAAGVSNKKLDDKLESRQKKLLKEEPATMEGAEAYAAGDYDGYMNAIDSLTEKGYGKGFAIKAIDSAYRKLNGGSDEEEEEAYETITNDYWDNTPEKEPADYEMMFNAYMSGNDNDYGDIWTKLEENGKEEKNIKSSMKTRLKKAYKDAKLEGNYQKAQRAKTEFLRLGGKPETLEG